MFAGNTHGPPPRLRCWRRHGDSRRQTTPAEGAGGIAEERPDPESGRSVAEQVLVIVAVLVLLPVDDVLVSIVVGSVVPGWISTAVGVALAVATTGLWLWRTRW